MKTFNSTSWVVEERLGGGSLCTSTRVRSLDGHLAVLRELRPEYQGDDARRLLLREEAVLLSRLSHPHLRRCDGYRDEPPAQLLEHVDGADLASFLAVLRDRGTRFEPQRALDVVGQLALVLAYLHPLGVAHLDLTPDNVLIERTGRVVLTDLSRGTWPQRTTVTAHEPIPAKFGYTSPELWDGRTLGPPSDIFQLGVLLWETLAGTEPEHVTPPQPGSALPPLVPLVRVRDDLPAPLYALVHQLTAREPEARPRAGDVLDGLIRRARHC